MAGTQILQIKAEDVDFLSAELSSPSFKGRLNLSDFTFESPLAVTLRRSPRILSVKVEEPDLPAPVPLPGNKRRAGSLSVSTSESSSPRKKTRSPTGYAPPSTYAHLPELPDILEPNLHCIFVGLNPGIRTATTGHAYSHPSNRFWKLLHSSGLTTRRLKPEEDRDLPALFSLGNTNIVRRPTRSGAELSKTEMDDSVQILEDKIRKFKPEVVCIVGKSIWESVWRVRHGKAIKKEQFKYGWQDESENMGVLDELKREEDAGVAWNGAKVFVTTTTSGLAATPTAAEREIIWRGLGEWIEQRRIETATITVDIVAGIEGVTQQDV